MLGLRCQEGVSIKDLQKLGYYITQNKEYAKLIENGVIFTNNYKITLNPTYYGVSNSVIVKLLP